MSVDVFAAEIPSTVALDEPFAALRVLISTSLPAHRRCTSRPRGSQSSARSPAHLHELRIELAEDFDQISLRGHDGVDVFVDISPRPARSARDRVPRRAGRVAAPAWIGREAGRARRDWPPGKFVAHAEAPPRSPRATGDGLGVFPQRNSLPDFPASMIVPARVTIFSTYGCGIGS